MSNDPDANGPEEEPPTASIECHEWEVLALAASHLRMMADYIERPRAIITESYVRQKLMRVEELISIHEDLTRPALRYHELRSDDEHPF